MRKLLRPQDILLLGLANVLDIAEEVRDPFGIAAKSYKEMYGWIPRQYTKHNFNHLVWRSLKTGYIEKVIKDEMPYLRLTSLGKNRIRRDFPLLTLQKRRWDRKWRLVIFDIEEVSKQARERFRSKLKEVGFGMLQESVFISPYDIAKDFAEFIEAQGLADSAYVLEVSSIKVGDVKSLADKVWKLTELNRQYRRIIEKIEKIKNGDLTSASDRMKQLNASGEYGKIKTMNNAIWEEYLTILLKDPLLPKDLLPIDWEGEKARTLVRKLHILMKKNGVGI